MRPKAILAATLSCVRGMIADESGGTLIEYAIFLFLVSVAIGFLFPEITGALEQLFLRTTAEMNNAVSEAQTR